MSISEAAIRQQTHLLGHRLASVRLAQNRLQTQLAQDASIGLNTLRRLEAGDNVSLDTLVRVMDALGLGERLTLLAPPVDVRPVDRVRLPSARERRRASGTSPDTSPDWTWAENP